jgi:hypothetical protein
LTGTGYASAQVATWIEAQLIQAEAALRQGDGNWLTILNNLRATAPIPGTNQPQPSLLSSLDDPGDSPRDSARIALLFHERAAWFFADGHRQGDLRRLLRNYGWLQDVVYPAGAYLAPGLGVYGSDVTVPVPPSERANPLFHGCINRDA